MAGSAFRLRQAAHCLRQGGIVAYPTEAIYGLGCDPLNRKAVDRLLTLKQRPLSKGLILIAERFEQLIPYMGDLPREKLDTAMESWPGPHTWLLPASKNTPGWLTGGRNSIALRVTAHPVAAGLCRTFGGAIVSTSANLSGKQPAKTPLQVRLRCPGTDDILHGSTGPEQQPTRIRNALTGKVIRP